MQQSPLPLKRTCEPCAKEKIKCDSQKPVCGRCLRFGKTEEECVYTVNKSKLLRGRKERKRLRDDDDEFDDGFSGSEDERLPQRTASRPGFAPSTSQSVPPPNPPQSFSQQAQTSFPGSSGYSSTPYQLNMAGPSSFGSGSASYGPSSTSFQYPPFPTPPAYSAPFPSYGGREMAGSISGAGATSYGQQSNIYSQAYSPAGTAPQHPPQLTQHVSYGFYPNAPFQQSSSYNSGSSTNQVASNYMSAAGGSSIPASFSLSFANSQPANTQPAPEPVVQPAPTLQTPAVSDETPRSNSIKIDTTASTQPVATLNPDPAPAKPETSELAISDANLHTLRDSISHPAFREGLPGFMEVVTTFFTKILPFMPPLHRVYYFDHMSGLARYGPFIQLLKEVPLSSQNDHNGASRREVVTFHERCRELLSLIDSGGLGLSVDQLPRTGVRDLLILWSCVIPSISMSLESPVTFSLVRMTLVLVRKLGMNREEEAGTWGLEDGEPWHEEEKETVNRIWWALYTLDRQFSAIWEQLPMISDSECQLRMPKGEGFRVEEAPTPRYLADAMKNIGVESRRQAPTSAWFSLMGLHSIIGSITVYRSECASSRSEPYLPNPVLTSLLRRLDTWYAGLDPSVRLMDRQSIILGSAAIGADASLTESPRSTVVLIHGLIIYHAAEGQLTAPPGHKITAAWEESESAERWRQSCLRTGCVVRLMLSAGEESKLSTPFHIFNVYIVSFYHVVWLLHLKSRLNGRWRAAVLGSLVTFVVQNQSSDALLNNAGEQGNAFSSSQIEEFSSVPGVSEGNVGKGSATDVVEPPEPVDDEQNRLWNEVFNVITSLQFLLQALSPLGTRPRVKALALRSRRMLVRLLEEKEPLGSTNQFGTILLAEGGGDEDKEGA